MTKITAFLMLSFHLMSAAAVDLSFRPCSESPSHVEQRACMESLFEKTERLLVNAEEDTFVKLGMWDEDAVYRSKSRRAFLNSSSAFRKYRTAQCDYVWSLAAGGNGATDMKLSCAIELTEERIRKLEAYAHGLEIQK